MPRSISLYDLISLSTVQNNWGLGNLGRQDTNKTVSSALYLSDILTLNLIYHFLSDVFTFVANATSYQNVNVTGADIPLLNLTGTIPGALNYDAYVPYLAPDVNSTGAGGGPTFVAPNVNLSLNVNTAPAPVNLSVTTSGAVAGTRTSVQAVAGAAAFAVVITGLLL